MSAAVMKGQSSNQVSYTYGVHAVILRFGCCGYSSRLPLATPVLLRWPCVYEAVHNSTFARSDEI